MPPSAVKTIQIYVSRLRKAFDDPDVLTTTPAGYGLAAVATVADDGHRAARLLGAAATHRAGEPEDPVDARLKATFFEPARTRCGIDAWDAALRDGAALSFEDAVAYALEEAPATDGSRS